MAHKEIKTSIQINASPKRIWEIMIDFENYKNWNPFIQSISGTLKVGEQLKINVGGMKFKPELKEVEEQRKIKWLGKLLFKGIFDGEHSFHIIDNRNGTSTFKHEEVFNGILVGLFSNKLDTETKNGFIQMNQELKKMVENI